MNQLRPRPRASDATREPAFAPIDIEIRWLRMTGFLLRHLDTPADLLSDAIFAEIMTADDDANAWGESCPDDQMQQSSLDLYGIRGIGTSSEEAAADWRRRAHNAVGTVALQRGARL